MKIYPILKAFALLLLIAILLGVSQSKAMAQNQAISDSLARELNKAKEDTSKLKILIALTEHLFAYKDSCINLSNQGLELAQKLGLESKKAVFNLRIGATLIYSQHYDSSFYYFDKALEILKKYEDIELESRICTFYGVAYYYLGDYREGLNWYFKALELSKKINHKFYMAQNLRSIGYMYIDLNEFDNAIYYILESLKIAEELNNTLFIGMGYCAIANIYFNNRNNIEKGLEYYYKALENLLKLEKTISLAVTYNNIGLIYINKDEVLKAIEFGEKAFEIYISLNKQDQAANAEVNLGWYYSKLGKYEKADSILYRNYEYFKKTEAKPEIANTLRRMGDVYLEWGKYNKALDSYFRSYELNKNLGRKKYAVDIFERISKTYKKQKKYEKALEYYTLYHELNDSAFNEKMKNKINELEIRFETEKKEQQIELQETKLAQQSTELKQQRTLRNSLLGGLAAFFLIILLVAYAYFMKKKANKKIAMQMEEIETQAEHLSESNIILQQQALSAQMNPHFIFNTLNSIQYFIYNNNKEESNKYLSKFSKLMRLVLDNSQHQLIPIEKELEALELYLELETLRFGNKFVYTINCEEEALEYKIPALLIQPFAENAIIHGLANKNDGEGYINIDIKLENDTILCTIDDNGIGRLDAVKIRQAKNNGYKSLGTKITEKRLDIANSLYREKMTIKYTDKTGEDCKALGTKVEIALPLMQ